MRQQVNVTVALTYDCDARLSEQGLRRAITDSLSRLVCPPELPNEVRREVELVGRSITTLHEEAAIYGNDEPEPCPINRRPVDTCPDGCTHGQGPTIQPHTVEALRKAMAEAPADPRTGAAFVNIDTRVLALLLP